jgi:5-methylthioadenosine/S-adenosylhomocysteine deaminase
LVCSRLTERILVNDGVVITLDENGRILEHGSVVIEGDKILDVGRTDTIEKSVKPDIVVDAKRKLVIPGLVNTHYHTDITGRGTLEEMDLADSLDKRWYPMIREVNAQEAYWVALQGYCEAIRSGTTCVNDQYRQMISCAKAAEEIGIRAVLSCDVAVDDERLDTLQDNERLYREKNGSGDGRVSVFFGIEWLPIASEELLIKTRELANKYKTGIHIHLNEGLSELDMSRKKFGDTPVIVAHRTGILGPDCVAAHCVHVTDYEIKLLSDTHTSVSHNPTTNAKVGDGLARIPDMMRANVNVGLGHDSVCGNNNLDLFEVMKWASLLQRAARMDPSIMPARTMLDMATKNGAKALRIDAGAIRPGSKADIIIMDLRSHHFTPLILGDNFNVLSNLVYAAHGEDVDTTIIDGKIVMENRILRTVDESKVIEKATDAWNTLYERIDKKAWFDIRRT